MLLVVDTAALDVLGALDALEFAPADRAVREGAVLHPVHVILAALEACGLAPSQRLSAAPAAASVNDSVGVFMSALLVSSCEWLVSVAISAPFTR